MKFGHKNSILWIGFAVIFGSLASVFSFAGFPTDPSSVTINSLGWISQSAGWCVAVPNGAAVDLWAPAPAYVNRSQSRYAEILHADLVNPSVPVCARLGPATDTPALACDPVGTPADTTGFIASEGRFRTMEIQTKAAVPIWARSNAGTVTTCITVFW